MQHAFVIVATLLVLSGSGVAQWVGASHDTLTRDAHRDEVDAQALAVDASNTLHAVWKRAKPGGGWRLFYAKRPPAAMWTRPVEIADSTEMIYRYAVAVNRAMGTPYVAYERQSAMLREILLARDSFGVWVHTRITDNASEDLSPNIALDSAGFVHLAWIGQDSSNAWKISYATNRSGVFRSQILMGSDLGPFGSGAEPWIAVTRSGIAHIFYRGGDFGTYRIHYAWNAQPGGSAWAYEIISTPNGNDFTARAVVDGHETIHLLAGGNDGFGFPPRIYYLWKPITGTWSVPELTNQGRSGWGRSLTIDRFGKAHITLNEVSGNIYTGNLFYATNRTGAWSNTAILADGKTYGGTLVIDDMDLGHVIAYNGESFQTQEILVVHSTTRLTNLRNHEGEIPMVARLYQNYPNPFSPTKAASVRPTTRIPYSVNTRTHVRLLVVNVLGQVVATLLDEVRSPGEYVLDFDARGLASGLYLVRMVSGGTVQTVKMVITR